MGKTRILIVDDEINIRKFLRANLEGSEYEVLVASDGTEALKVIEKELPKLVILDIMMPKMDGFEVCRRLREWSQIPVIMLSARSDESDKTKCFDLGADDYITKPFGAKELIARIKAVLRRTEMNGDISTTPSFTKGSLHINFTQRQVNIADREVKLTPTEYSLLQELVLNKDKVLTYTHLLQKVWGPEYKEEREYLHVFARRLRAKIEPDQTAPKYIITVSGVGYKFQDTTQD